MIEINKMFDHSKHSAKSEYEPPELIEIQLLDESAKGFSDEPPAPAAAPSDSLNDDERFKREIDEALF